MTQLSQSTFCSELELLDPDNYDEVQVNKTHKVAARRSERIKFKKIEISQINMKPKKKVGRPRKTESLNKIKKPGRPRQIKFERVQYQMILKNMHFMQNKLMQCNKIICDYIFDTQKQNFFNKMNSKFNEILTNCNVHAIKWNAIKGNESKTIEDGNQNYELLNTFQSDVYENIKKLPAISKTLNCFQSVHKFIAETKQSIYKEPVKNDPVTIMTTCPSESVLKTFSSSYDNGILIMKEKNDQCKESFNTNIATSATNNGNDSSIQSQDLFLESSAPIGTSLDFSAISTIEPNEKTTENTVKSSQTVPKKSKKSSKKRSDNNKKQSQTKQSNNSIDTIRYDLLELLNENTVNINDLFTQEYESNISLSNIERQKTTHNIVDWMTLNEKPIELDEDEPNINNKNTNQEHQTASFQNQDINENTSAYNNNNFDTEYIHFYKNYKKNSPSNASYQREQETQTQIDNNFKTPKETEKLSDMKINDQKKYIEASKTASSNCNEQIIIHTPIIKHLTVDKDDSDKINLKILKNNTIEINNEKTSKQYDWLKPIKYVNVFKNKNNNQQRNVHKNDFWDNPNAPIPTDWLKDFDD